MESGLEAPLPIFTSRDNVLQYKCRWVRYQNFNILKRKRGTIGNPSGDLCWAVINVIVKEGTGEIVESNRGIYKETYGSYGRAPESRIHMIGGNRIGRERAHKITHQWEQTQILNSQSFQNL